MTTGFYSQTEPNYGAIRDPLRLETASHQWFVDPYGPHHPKAIAKLYAWDRMPYGFESHKHETYISRTDPAMDEGECCPVRFVRRTAEFIEVLVDFTGSRLWDKGGRDGQTVRLYPWTEPIN